MLSIKRTPHVELDNIALHAKAKRSNTVHFAQRIDHLGGVEAEQFECWRLDEFERCDAREAKRPHKQADGSAIERGPDRGLANRARARDRSLGCSPCTSGRPQRVSRPTTRALLGERVRALDEGQNVGEANFGWGVTKSG